MTDTTAGQTAGGFRLPGIGSLGDLAKRGDLALAVGVLTILMVLILPLPAILLDFSLAISIILSVLILMTALFIHAPLEFSSFPTVLLISTMLRLALNLASTRLILARGHEGTAAAGHVTEAFGNFVMSGTFLIGGIGQQGMPFAEAARTYTLLTVGDGLVTQIPALIVSTAAGLLVSKAGVGGGVDKAHLKQLSGYPKALGMSAAVMIVMSLLPGIPMLPFMALGAGAGMLAYVIEKRTRLAAATEAAQATTASRTEPTDEPIST